MSNENAILAGIIMAGPRGEQDSRLYDSKVIAGALEAQSMMHEKSRISKTISEAKSFVAVVVSTKKETSTTRGLVTLKVKPSTYSPDGVEQIRTERSDRPDGQAMAKKMVALKGHRVLIYKVNELMANGKKSALILHVKDLGEATGDEFGEDD